MKPLRLGQTRIQFLRWWAQLSLSRQDRMVALGPLVSVLLFLAAVMFTFWYLNSQERARELASINHDTGVVQQQMQSRLMENQEQLIRLARDIVRHRIDEKQFLDQAAELVHSHPEMLSVSWTQADRHVVASQVTSNLPFSVTRDLDSVVSAQNSDALALQPYTSEFQDAFEQAKALQKPVYSTPHNILQDTPVFQVHVPLLDKQGFAGTLVAEYSVQGLLREVVPVEISSHTSMSLLQANGQVLASTSPLSRSSNAVMSREMMVTPTDHGLYLRGQTDGLSSNLIGRALFWLLILLSTLTMWMLINTWRHMRRRTQMQRTLASEANFRRAMENSVLTGMRAIDLEGRITYVNRAFCSMTGFSESELIGCMPPYPHWPRDQLEESHRRFEQELAGLSPPGGMEIRVQHKDGHRFDARIYVSPLVDANGVQTGWMTSMTNITEAKRVRDQLSAAHERFTTVLESLDAAIAVFSAHGRELLFANRSYRLWFGADGHGQSLLSGGGIVAPPPADRSDPVDSFGGLPTQEMTEVPSDAREIHVDAVQKWFEVRSRYIQWTDGRLARMLIATDITARKRAEEQAQQQAEKAQVTSRLMTMGEMASSVAHELNQPLTAITNYCNGMVNRVKNGTIDNEGLIAALEKTARQAQRAGLVIHRIRAFVKRSEPQRQPTRARDVVEDAIELASIELRRRRVHLHSYVAPRLPTLMMDPILIEQVLLNLIKNAAEAIDNAKLSISHRHIELRVVKMRGDDSEEAVEFSVADAGPGIKEEVLGRLFEAFFSTKQEGLGIGLSLCRSIVESHRGRLRAENLYNGSSVTGCRFSFTLPIEPVQADFVDSRTSDTSNDLLADTP